MPKITALLAENKSLYISLPGPEKLRFSFGNCCQTSSGMGGMPYSKTRPEQEEGISSHGMGRENRGIHLAGNLTEGATVRLLSLLVMSWAGKNVTNAPLKSSWESVLSPCSHAAGLLLPLTGQSHYKQALKPQRPFKGLQRSYTFKYSVKLIAFSRFEASL